MDKIEEEVVNGIDNLEISDTKNNKKIEEEVVNGINNLEISGKKNKKKIVIGITGTCFSDKFLISIVSTIVHIKDSEKYDVVLSPGKSSFIPFARMNCLGLDVLKGIDQKPFDGMDFDIMIFIDSDIVFSPQNVIELIESLDDDKHVVSGVYRMEDLKNFAAVEKLDSNYFKENGCYQYLTQDKIDEWKSNNNKNKYMKVAYSGMGFMAISKEALYSLTYPYFHSELQELRGKDGKMLRDLCSEDFAFCSNLRKNSYDIYVIPTLRVGHLKPLVI